MIDIQSFKYDANGLIPVVVQDVHSKDVLMLAYMNEEAVKETLEKKIATYFSRSRQQLWKKGETSGHIQTVHEMRYDCDEDTLLLLVEQAGVACHTLHKSCFYRSMDAPLNATSAVLDEIYATVKDRKAHPKEGAYTTYLFEQGIDKILKKVGEESAEVIIAAKGDSDEDLINETSDLLYHLSVLFNEKNIPLQAVYQCLKDRQS